MDDLKMKYVHVSLQPGVVYALNVIVDVIICH